MSMGRKFREEITEETLKDAFKLGVEEFKQKTSREEQRLGRAINVDNIDRWCQRVIENFNRKYNRQETKLPTNASKKQVTEELKRMQEVFVISPCDKLSHNFAITCKHLYLKELRHEMLHNQTYQKVEVEDVEEWVTGNEIPNDDETYVYRRCLARHKVFNDAHNLEHKDNLFYLYGIAKVHKKKWRFIAGVGKSLLPTHHGNDGDSTEESLSSDGSETTIELRRRQRT